MLTFFSYINQIWNWLLNITSYIIPLYVKTSVINMDFKNLKEYFYLYNAIYCRVYELICKRLQSILQPDT